MSLIDVVARKEARVACQETVKAHSVAATARASPTQARTAVATNQPGRRAIAPTDPTNALPTDLPSSRRLTHVAEMESTIGRAIAKRASGAVIWLRTR